MYLSYSDYQRYGGELDETNFTDLEFDAESIIDWYTFNRLKRPEWENVLESEELRRCVYQLVRLLNVEAGILASSVGGAGWGVGWSKEAGITEESNDGVVTKYNTASTGELMSNFVGGKQKEDVIQRYLNITNDLGYNILYRGVYPWE